ncbi:hypothetical protein D9756_001370 [Leucocoprinus leucothites]|uniref:tRNA(Ile)-lysidine synthetase n=1 Tax=Leucocoprinus leucothites TaxID=201217 RepID=A0A8H5G4E1_9AGAR|nr:hypothetical protein D9756_001370 [Leucoagaricus leucothites]
MRPRPISREEFARFLQKARPPSGWPAHIGVANSGGPDSTCLLFLLQRYIEDSKSSELTSPARVYSLTIDHALQASSATMAEQSARTATSLHIPHTTLRIPWGTPPFPPLPDKSKAFEGTARMARYNLLWKWMQKENIGTVAMGHHADDQVETALMRLGKKSSELGARGMLACRRWGMGMKNELEWAGIEGMKKWIVRPLLEVSKDRILATCEENELNYVIDPTNFQPDVTLRNAIRAIVSSKDKGEEPPDLTELPPKIQKDLMAINQNINAFSHITHQPLDLNSSSESLRAAVKAIDVYATDIEDRATSQIARIRLPSPPGSFVLSTRAVQEILDPTLRRAIALRILRYISFHPWGSLRSQARRSQYALDQIVARLWDPQTFYSNQSNAFAAGGGVLWAPVVVDTTTTAPSFLDAGGKIKRPQPSTIRNTDMRLGKGVVGWMATRQPPHRPEKMMEYGLEDTLNVDVTPTLKAGLKAWDTGNGLGPSIIEVLWDCRFLVQFDLAKMPKDVREIVLSDVSDGPRLAIRWWTHYFCPKIDIVPPGESLIPPDIKIKTRAQTLHSNIDSYTPSRLLMFRQKAEEDSAATDIPKLYRNGQIKESFPPPLTSGWINTSWIRTLDPS